MSRPTIPTRSGAGLVRYVERLALRRRPEPAVPQNVVRREMLALLRLATFWSHGAFAMALIPSRIVEWTVVLRSSENAVSSCGVFRWRRKSFRGRQREPKIRAIPLNGVLTSRNLRHGASEILRCSAC